MKRTSLRLALSAAAAAVALPTSVALAGKAARGGVTVQNKRDETVRVVLDGELVGLLPAGGRSSFAATEGRHSLRLEDVDGELIHARKVAVEKGERTRVRLGGADATLIVENGSGVAMTVKTTDREGRARRLELAPGAEAELPVTAGEVDLRAYHSWHQIDRRVASDELRLAPGEVERFVLQPLEEALVRVVNRADAPLTLSLDGERLGLVPADSTGYVLAPIGPQTLDCSYLGVDAGTRRVRVDPDRGAQVGVSLETGEFEVVNRAKVVTRAVVDGHDFGAIRPGESRVLELPIGAHELTFVAPNGTMLQERAISVEADERTTMAFRPQPGFAKDPDLAAAYRMGDPAR